VAVNVTERGLVGVLDLACVHLPRLVGSLDPGEGAGIVCRLDGEDVNGHRPVDPE
jgi:hypothetical protein